MWHDKLSWGLPESVGDIQSWKLSSGAAKATVHLTAQGNCGHKTCWAQTSVLPRAGTPKGRYSQGKALLTRGADSHTGNSMSCQ